MVLKSLIAILDNFVAGTRSAMSSETLRILIRGNDVIVGPPYAVWNPNEAPNDRILNWWYADLTADGGYNHFELRRYKRAYTLPGVFQQGDLAPPMREASLWLIEDVFERD